MEGARTDLAFGAPPCGELPDLGFAARARAILEARPRRVRGGGPEFSMSICGGEPHARESVLASDEHLRTRGGARETRVRRLGRLRVPIALHYQPWATLYRLPDGRLLFCVRLWEGERPVTRVVDVATVRAYARQNRLTAFAEELESLLDRARPKPGARAP